MSDDPDIKDIQWIRFDPVQLWNLFLNITPGWSKVPLLSHEVIEFTLVDGAKIILDATGAQFGFLKPWCTRGDYQGFMLEGSIYPVDVNEILADERNHNSDLELADTIVASFLEEWDRN